MFGYGEVFDSEYPDFTEHGEPPCVNAPDIFFSTEREDPTTGKVLSATYKNEREAKMLCNSCPYKAECLEYALKNPQPGIWGGLKELERKSLLRSRIKSRDLTSRDVVWF